MTAEPMPVILYVDDEEINLTVFNAHFKNDYQLFCVSSGLEALDVLKENEIDVIISDQRMPEMTGTEMLKRSLEINPTPGKIILSGYSDASIIIEAVNFCRIDAYVTKPWDHDVLKSFIDRSVHEVRTRKNLTAQTKEGS